MKKTVIGLGGLFVIALFAVALWLYSSLDSLVLAAIEKYGPEMTQTSVKVAAVKLAPADGNGSITGLRIGNPRGFRADHALNAGAIELGIDPSSVARDVILIRRIVVLAPDINYETADAGSNFDVIQNNVERYVERTLGKSDAAARDKSPGKKLIVEVLSIRDAKVSYAPALLKGKTLTLSLPNIELRNIGKAKGGITAGELVGEINAALKSRLSRAVTQPIKGAAQAVGKAAKGVGDKLKGLFK